MVSKFSVALSFSVATMSICLFVPANAKSDIKPTLQAVYASRDAALVNKNIQGTLAPYVADVVIINADDQSTGLAAQRDDLSKLFASNITLSSPTTEIEEFVADKTGHEATTRAVHHITVNAVSATTGQPEPSVIEEVVRDHWVDGKNGWHITQERRLTKSTLFELCSAAARGPVKASVIGKWIGNLPSRPGTTAQMLLEFTADGKELQTIVAPNQNIVTQATYTTNDNVLTETQVMSTKNGRVMPGTGQVQVLHYRIVADTLFISLPGSTDELQFARQSEGQ